MSQTNTAKTPTHPLKGLLFLVLVIGTCGLGSAAWAASAQKLYDQALLKESGERDPDAAVDLYRQAIEQAGIDHRLASKARLRMGNCLERIGKPKEAEEIYLQIINESTVSLMEAVQAAQANLERLQAQEKKAKEEADKYKPMVLIKEFHDTKFAVLAGPELLMSGKKSTGDVDVAVRYRLSPENRPSAFFAEVGGFYPFTSKIKDESNASLKLNYQVHIGFAADLPHGTQKTIVPQMGVGFAFTSSKIETSGGSSDETAWSPRLSAGLHLYPERQVSYLINASYTANPYQKTFNNQTYGFPSSLWTFGAQVQIKIGSMKASMRPKE